MEGMPKQLIDACLFCHHFCVPLLLPEHEQHHMHSLAYGEFCAALAAVRPSARLLPCGSAWNII
jgi:hypothetical protein